MHRESLRKKMQATMSQWVLAVKLVCWESGTSFLDQLQSKVKQNLSNLRLLLKFNDWKFTKRLQSSVFFVCILVTEPEPECDFPEPIGNGDISDDGMPDMGEVSTVTYSCSKQ